MLSLPMPRNFDGIREKLKRAKENILNLEMELSDFFQKGEYPIWRYDDRETSLKAIAYHRNRKIPVRFSVLAGEILHHLRSVLDHVVWQFSGEWYRVAKPTQIEFPIFKVKPTQKAGRTGYERQVKGISDPAALILIEYLQPYNSTNPIDHLLFILHDLNRNDKHRDVLLCVSTGAVPIAMDMLDRYMRYQRGEPGSVPVDVTAEFKRNPQIVPQVSFRNFGDKEIEPIVQGLARINNFVVQACEKFAILSDYVY
jgi:hypothetical protein